MKIQISGLYTNPTNGHNVMIVSRNHMTGLFDGDDGTTYRENGEWAGGGWALEEIQFGEEKPLPRKSAYVIALEAMLTKEQIQHAKDIADERVD